MANSVVELKYETGIEHFDAVLEVQQQLTFALAGEPFDTEHRLTEGGVWIGPSAHVRVIPPGVYGITRWNGDLVWHGFPASAPDEFDQEDVLALVEEHRVARWLQSPPGG